jgi:hypothetical protein
MEPDWACDLVWEAARQVGSTRKLMLLVVVKESIVAHVLVENCAHMTGSRESKRMRATDNCSTGLIERSSYRR